MRIPFLFRWLVPAVLLLSPTLSQAQVFRAYLSASGNDANACTLASPCRLLPRALTAVADGGEVWMLDSANYNTTTVPIAKSVTVLAVPGVVGSLVGSNNSVIDISTPGVKVTLRNLVIKPQLGAPPSLSGIVVSAAASLTVESSVLSGFGNAGIDVVSAALVNIVGSTIRDVGGAGVALQAGASATIVDSHIVDNGGAGLIVFGTTGSGTIASVSRCTISGNQAGIIASTSGATDKAVVTLRGSTIDRNLGAGITAQSVAGGPALVTATGNVISSNTLQGILATSIGARVVAGDNTVTGNLVGLLGSSGGTVETYSDNRLRDNGSPSGGAVSSRTKS